MLSSTYHLIYRLPGVTVYRLMMAEGVVFIASIILYEYLESTAPGLEKLFAFLTLSLMAGMLWLFIRLTRAPCTLTLDDDGFSIVPDSTFHLMPKQAIRYSWSQFSYQSGALTERRDGYEIMIHLNDGKPLAFLTGSSFEDQKKSEQLHHDIERRVSEFQQKRWAAVGTE